MSKQTFEIIDGVYAGPSIWEGHLDLRPYKDTLTSLGDLKKVEGDFWLMNCTILTSLGSLKKVGRWLYLYGCTSLTSLGSLTKVGGALALNGCSHLLSLGDLKEVGGMMALEDCTSLTSLGILEEVGGSLDLRGCTNLVHLGSLIKVESVLFFGDEHISLQEVQENISYYTSLPLHEALNSLHTKEIQRVPLYRNILLQTLQGG